MIEITFATWFLGIMTEFEKGDGSLGATAGTG